MGVMYVVSAYQMIFAASTVIFECPPEYIQKVPQIDQYQDMLGAKCAFLTEFVGRGMFYIFQGSLWLCFASLTDLLDLVTGLLQVFIGVLHVLMHFGVMPQHVATKMQAGYSSL